MLLPADVNCLPAPALQQNPSFYANPHPTFENKTQAMSGNSNAPVKSKIRLYK